MKTTAFLLTMLVPAVVSAQQKPTTGYAPVNGLKMYYEVHGSGDPVVLLHGAFMTITNMTTTIRYASKADRDAAFATGMTDGMEVSYKQLDGVLAEG